MSYPDTQAIEHTLKKLDRIIRDYDRQQVAIARGDMETVAKIGRSFYRNDKAKKWRMYEAAGWLRRYVTGQSGGLSSVEDCRRVSNDTHKILNQRDAQELRWAEQNA